MPCLSSFLFHSQLQAPHQWQSKKTSSLWRENLAAMQWLLSRKSKWSRQDNLLPSLVQICNTVAGCTNFTPLCQAALQLSLKRLSTFLCHSPGQNVCHHYHIKIKIVIAALVIAETLNLLVFCWASLCLGAWGTRQTWSTHHAVWMQLIFSVYAHITQTLLASLGVMAHVLDSLQKPASSLQSGCVFFWAHQLILKTFFSRYTSFTGYYLMRLNCSGRWCTNQF